MTLGFYALLGCTIGECLPTKKKERKNIVFSVSSAFKENMNNKTVTKVSDLLTLREQESFSYRSDLTRKKKKFIDQQQDTTDHILKCCHYVVTETSCDYS